MKGWAYLIPTAALALVLMRMATLQLARQRAGFTAFLLAWLFYSFLAILLFQAKPFEALDYARNYLALTGAVWCFGAIALWPAAARVATSCWKTSVAVLAVCAAGWMAAQLFGCAGDNRIVQTLAASCGAAILAGAIFLLGSLGAELPERILWRGAGFFFLVYGTLGIASRVWWPERGELLLIAAGTLAWLLLAASLPPKADALFNLEKLGIVWPLYGRLFTAKSLRPLCPRGQS